MRPISSSRASSITLLALLLTLTGILHRAHAAEPAVAIIIDDLGYRYKQDLRAVNLPARITYAFLPHTPHAHKLARHAHQLGKEVMLHVPMQGMGDHKLGPGALTLDMTEHAFKNSLRQSIDSVPYVRGINNHMGSLLTRHPGHMAWLMETMLEFTEPMYFIDSRTTHHTIAQRIAAEHGIPHARRHVFLDTEPHDRNYVRAQFQQLLRQAKQKGPTIAIGHPYPATLDVLKAEIHQLEEQGIRLLTVSELLQETQRRNTWRASLSPLPRAAKN